MKQLLTLVLALLLSLTSISQIKGTYKAIRTERYDLVKGQWKHVSTNENVNIPIVMLAGFIHIKAESDGYISYDEKTLRTLDEPTYRGLQYTGYDYVLGQRMVVNMVVFKSGGSAISIVFSDLGINIIYTMESTQ